MTYHSSGLTVGDDVGLVVGELVGYRVGCRSQLREKEKYSG